MQWFTRENVDLLNSNIKSLSFTQTLNGKVVEFLFALEVCASAYSKLWAFLHKKYGLVPLSSWKPIISLTGNINDCVDIKSIYVMTDPHRSNCKTDVIFFATNTHTQKMVKTLVQLTIASCSIKKVNDSFDVMLNSNHWSWMAKNWLIFDFLLAPIVQLSWIKLRSS